MLSMNPFKWTSEHVKVSFGTDAIAIVTAKVTK